MNAQTLTRGFCNWLQPTAERSAARQSAALKARFNTATCHAAPACATPDAFNAGHATLLARYRADPVALRRAVAVNARAARNQAIFSTLKRMFHVL